METIRKLRQFVSKPTETKPMLYVAIIHEYESAKSQNLKTRCIYDREIDTLMKYAIRQLDDKPNIHTIDIATISKTFIGSIHLSNGNDDTHRLTFPKEVRNIPHRL